MSRLGKALLGVVLFIMIANSALSYLTMRKHVNELQEAKARAESVMQNNIMTHNTLMFAQSRDQFAMLLGNAAIKETQRADQAEGFNREMMKRIQVYVALTTAVFEAQGIKPITKEDVEAVLNAQQQPQPTPAEPENPQPTPAPPPECPEGKTT